MPTALEDIRARLDRGLGRVPDDVPTLESLKARIAAAKGLPSIPRRRPEVPGIMEIGRASCRERV